METIKPFNITVDFLKAIQYYPIHFVMNDSNSSKLTMTIVQDITDKLVSVSFELPDGTTTVTLAATNIDDHTAETTLPTEVLSIVGKVNCQVALYDGDSRLTNPVLFYFVVDADLTDNIISDVTDQAPILTQLINDVISLNADMESAEQARYDAEALRVEAEMARSVYVDYSPVTAYVVGNKVVYDYSSYYCIQDCTGILPTNTTYWLLITKKFDATFSVVDGDLIMEVV